MGVAVRARKLQKLGGRRVDVPAAGRHVLGRDERVRVRMALVAVDEERRVEDLEGLVRVHGDDGLRDRREVPVQEVAQAPTVLQRAHARTARDEELEAGRAEGVLQVDRQQADACLVARHRGEPVLRGPGERVPKARLVIDTPHVPDAIDVDVRWERKLVHFRTR
jgi:hypothetical protein